MGFRFSKRMNLGKGLRMNLSKSGIGFSFGRPGARISINPNGKRNISVGVPDTGMSYRTGCALPLVFLVCAALLGLYPEKRTHC